ncbi:MAG: PTS sugar transporter subunit IIA [Oscillospiraceae bacterium]|nr:PTS sugar transporter subunit IIA [Oscillospiraceae bacterium]
MITSLLEKEGHLLANVTCKDWETVVDLLAAPLIAEDAVTPEFAESAKEAAKQFGGYVVLVEDIAFFHGRPEAGVREISMTLALLTEPVYLFEKRIKAAFLFAAVDTESHGELLRGLAAIMNDDTCLDLLRDGKDPQAILKKCKEVEEANEVS